MKHLISMSVMALLVQWMTGIASAQEPNCGTCHLPPQAVGRGGFTCEIAKKVFDESLPAKDSVGFYDGETTFDLNSQVYCKPGYGYFAQGGSTRLVIHSGYEQNAWDNDDQYTNTASLDGIMGLNDLSSGEQQVIYDKHGSACFSRSQYFYSIRNGWTIPEPRIHFYSYECRIPSKNDLGLICKVLLDGKIEIGYQIYLMNSQYGSELPEGLLR